MELPIAAVALIKNESNNQLFYVLLPMTMMMLLLEKRKSSLQKSRSQQVGPTILKYAFGIYVAASE
jgi:hypothetical protein